MKNVFQRTILRIPNLIRFLPIYLREMTLSNLRVALDALRPEPRFHPGFLRISLKGYDPLQWWEAASLITMTPGTLSVDFDEKSETLLVHSLYLQDPEQTKQELEKLVRQSLGAPAPELR
jgi:multisubunit Na+/H+ antiporter MnhE subunit